jgi:hypothetical protein
MRALCPRWLVGAGVLALVLPGGRGSTLRGAVVEPDGTQSDTADDPLAIKLDGTPL